MRFMVLLICMSHLLLFIFEEFLQRKNPKPCYHIACCWVIAPTRSALRAFTYEHNNLAFRHVFFLHASDLQSDRRTSPKWGLALYESVRDAIPVFRICGIGFMQQWLYFKHLVGFCLFQTAGESKGGNGTIRTKRGRKRGYCTKTNYDPIRMNFFRRK